MTSRKDLAQSEITKLDTAWAGMEKAIHALGENIRSLTEGEGVQARYEGYQALLALVADNFHNQVYADPARPEYLPYLGLQYNYAGPAADFGYYITHIIPGQAYRVRGMRGDAPILDVQHLTGWYGAVEDPRKIVTTGNHNFDARGMRCAADGSFDFIMSETQPEGQWADHDWWQLEPGVCTLLFREMFDDYERQQTASVMHFEPLDGRRPSFADRKHLQMARQFDSVARAAQQFLFCFNMGKSFAPLGDNAFRSENFGGDAGQSDQLYIQARYNIPEDHVLIGEWKVPDRCDYWGWNLYNDLYSTLNFADRQVNLNARMSDVGPDGKLRFVLSDFDPGVRNWLDIDGHPTGIVLLRAKNSHGHGEPVLRLVPRDQLDAQIVGMKRISSSERIKMLNVRRAHYQRRMRR